jgi:transcription antitermination factor NusG
MEKKLTAVEWYMIRVSEIEEANVSNNYKNMAKAEIFIAALAMEKEQIEDAYRLGKVKGKVNSDDVYAVTPDDYYTKTYGK